MRIRARRRLVSEAAPFLRGQVSAGLRLRYMPRLRFELDRSFEEAQKIETLLRSEKVKRDLGPGGDKEGPDDGPGDGRDGAGES